MTTNLEFYKWGSIFRDGQMEAAMIDRLYSQTPEKVKEKICLLQRKLIYTGMFLTRKGLCEEADDFCQQLYR